MIQDAKDAVKLVLLSKIITTHFEQKKTNRARLWVLGVEMEI